MKKSISALAACAMFSVAGFAGASEPMQLSDNQMDAVSAGAYSIAEGYAVGVLATVVSNSESGTLIKIGSGGTIAKTKASSFNMSSGYVVKAASGAAAEL